MSYKPSEKQSLNSRGDHNEYPVLTEQQLQELTEVSKNAQRRHENVSKLSRNLRDETPKPPDKTPEQRQLDEQYNKAHEEFMGQIAGRLRGLHEQYANDLEADQAQLREEFRSGSKSSQGQGSGFWNNGVVSPPDTDKSEKKKDSKDADGQKSNTSKPRATDDFDIIYGGPDGQGLDTSSRQLNGQDLKDLSDTSRNKLLGRISRISENAEKYMRIDQMVRNLRDDGVDSDKFYKWRDEYLKTKGVDPYKLEETVKRLETHLKNGAAGQPVSVIDLEKTCSDLERMFRRLERRPDDKRRKI